MAKKICVLTNKTAICFAVSDQLSFESCEPLLPDIKASIESIDSAEWLGILLLWYGLK